MANEVPGICLICGRAGRLFTCQLCGSLVCGMHYDQAAGACANCSRGRRGSVGPMPGKGRI